ncbi:amidase signature domain-containing protein [Aspergillus granulosus]|uniref:Amidase signature domain-containing protein n=1 Tax=Aspergillus granulosus TaxID=176169 RepID=A0ABR4HYT2_9EURO
MISRCCVATTIRECNDRGYECCLLSDCTDGFDAQMVTTAMDTICAQDGLFGYVGDSSDFLEQTANYSLKELALPEGILPPIKHLIQRYRQGREDPLRIVDMIYDRIEKNKERDPAVWIHVQSREDTIAATKALTTRYENKHDLPPLFGVPFAVQDSIDVAGIPTTAGCEAYTYTPALNATTVEALLDAGAIFIGKLNFDQLGVDLLGHGSTYGTPRSIHSPEHIAGGSSSGAAIAVGAGLVSFTLARDTAGGSLVTGGFNGTVTLKPTKGTISNRGVVPICPSLDSVSIMARTVEDARVVWLEIQKCNNTNEPYTKLPASLPTWHIDARDPSRWKSKFRFAVPPMSLLDAVCSKDYRELFSETIETLGRCGGTLVQIDYEPFQTASKLLVPGDAEAPNLLVYEHMSTIGADFLETNISTLHPRMQNIYKHHISAPSPKPWTIFKAQACLLECVQRAQALFNPLNPKGIDILVVPSAPAHPKTGELEIQTASEVLETRIGEFTRAVNALDLCAVGLNAGWVKESSFTDVGLPFGVTFLGGTGYDAKILDLARDFVEGRYDSVSE